MADFGGFEFQTPQEVLYELSEQRRKSGALSSNNIRERQYATYDAGIKAIFGTPELDLATKRTAAADKSFTDLERRNGEDDLDFRQRQTQAFFDNIKEVDPALAAQASEKLTAIQNEKMERKMLLSGESRKQSNEDRLATQHEQANSKRKRQDMFDNLGYAFDRRTGKAKAYDLSIPSEANAMQAAARDENMQIMTREEMVDWDAAKLKDAEGDMMLKSTFDKKLSTYSAAQNALNRTSRMVEIITADPTIMSTPAALEKTLANAAIEVNSALVKFGMESKGYNKDLQYIRGRIAPEARARGVTESMILNLAYANAKALDEGGRLSDKDLELAISMLGGENADPTIFARIALENAEATTKKQTEAFATLQVHPDFATNAQGTVLTEANNRLLRERDRLRKLTQPFMSQEEYNAIVHGIPQTLAPVTPGTPYQTEPTVAEDGKTINAPAEISITIPGLR